MTAPKSFPCLPSLLVIGPGHSGTTTFGDRLRHHPQVSVGRRSDGSQELDFWGQQRYPLPEYLASFDARDPVGVDVSPSYLDIRYAEPAAKAARHHLAHAKVLAILRRPVQRAWSSWLIQNQYRFLNTPDDWDRFGRHARQEVRKNISAITYWIGAFGSDFEAIPFKTVIGIDDGPWNELWRWLDVDQIGAPPVELRNRSGRLPPVVDHVTKAGKAMVGALVRGGVMPARGVDALRDTAHRMRSWLQRPKPQLPPEVLADLEKRLRPEVEALCATVGWSRAPTSWTSRPAVGHADPKVLADYKLHNG